MAYVLGSGLDFISHLNQHKASKVFLLTDSHLHKLYPHILEGLQKPLHSFVLEAGEQSKNFVQMERILLALTNAGFGRKDVLVGFGGGVVGDLAGLCAGLYMRGMDYIALPTSIIAMADSALGGKTAINFAGLKNNIGLFYEPSQIFADTNFLATLPEEERHSGMGELVKIALLTGDTECLENLPQMIQKAADYKLTLVTEDPYDHGIRHLLNLGHTMGHVIELSFGIPHGQAVAMGLDFITKFSDHKGVSQKLNEKVLAILKQYGLPTLEGVALTEPLLQKLYGDKKNQGSGKIKLALLEDIGRPLIAEYTIQEIMEFALC